MSDREPFEDDVRRLREREAELVRRIEELENELAELREQRSRVSRALTALVGDTQTGKVQASAITHDGKYRPLWDWLRRQDRQVIRVTFRQVEEILRFPLPPSSRRHLPHWYGYEGSAVARAIRDAGYRARNVDIQQETVEFHLLATPD